MYLYTILGFSEENIVYITFTSFTYHFYDGLDNGVSKLGVRSLNWDSNGWPILGDHLVDQK